MSVEDLGQQEQAVLDAITANPFAGQQEIAASLGLARSTIAAHIVQLVQKGYVLGRGYVLPKNERIVCLGGATVDRKYYTARPLIPETSNPVEGHRSYGGVARNVAENLARLGVDVSLISILGDDEAGNAVLRHLHDLGVDASRVVTTREKPTAEYVAVLGPDRGLVLGLADMDIFGLLTTAHIERAWPHLASASWVLADCNMPGDVLAHLVRRRQGARFKLALDAVSTPKVRRLPQDLTGIDLLFLNKDEADAYLEDATLTPAEAAKALRARGAREVVLTLGARGAVVAAGHGAVETLAAVPAHPVDVTGAGDAMISGTLYRLLAGETLAGAVRVGALLAAMTTENDASVHPELSPRFLAASMARIPDFAGATVS
ncbi:pseudouridine kinase [Rhizobiales bacterium GAS191]|nr:pseudouridine kinase [Rhizobiales bacterium GAS113]SED85670.1 pseudouridine kinase [Rhizobiales bacterium GAS191]